MEGARQEQTPDVPGLNAKACSRELTELELMKVSGGDGPPSTAGDGNGRASWHRLLR
jgi:hypothetical protein